MAEMKYVPHNQTFRQFYGVGALAVVLIVLAAVVFAPARAHTPGAADPTIAALLAQVETTTLLGYANQLSGETAATVGGAPYTFTTRNTESGAPITKATQFAYEFFEASDLTARYHAWAGCGIAGRNVVGELPGATSPDEIVLVTAHLDSINEAGDAQVRAPGADDDASGVAGVMAAAEILAAHQFQRTLRFVLFTGEEQGLCGSFAYAHAADTAGEKIVAVLNLDMIAWDGDNDPIVRLHTRRTRDAGYAADKTIADTFIAVVTDYALELTPRIAADGEEASDTYAFWSAGYPGILAIEDDLSDDFNPNYHSDDDTVSGYNQGYFTNFVKATVGASAVLAGLSAAATPTPIPPAGPYKVHLPAIRR